MALLGTSSCSSVREVRSHSLIGLWWRCNEDLWDAQSTWLMRSGMLGLLALALLQENTSPVSYQVPPGPFIFLCRVFQTRAWQSSRKWFLLSWRYPLKSGWGITEEVPFNSSSHFAVSCLYRSLLCVALLAFSPPVLPLSWGCEGRQEYSLDRPVPPVCFSLYDVGMEILPSYFIRRWRRCTDP